MGNWKLVWPTLIRLNNAVTNRVWKTVKFEKQLVEAQDFQKFTNHFQESIEYTSN